MKTFLITENEKGQFSVYSGGKALLINGTIEEFNTLDLRKLSSKKSLLQKIKTLLIKINKKLEPYGKAAAYAIHR